jgi:hypothetical protein
MQADRVIDRHVFRGDGVRYAPCGIGALARREDRDGRAHAIERPAQVDGRRPRRVEQRVRLRERRIGGIAIESERDAVGPPRRSAERRAPVRDAAAVSTSASFVVTTACGNARWSMVSTNRAPAERTSARYAAGSRSEATVEAAGGRAAGTTDGAADGTVPL